MNDMDSQAEAEAAALHFNDVLAAAARIAPYAHVTPVLRTGHRVERGRAQDRRDMRVWGDSSRGGEHVVEVQGGGAGFHLPVDVIH